MSILCQELNENHEKPNLHLSNQKLKLNHAGIEPGTFRILVQRATDWATWPTMEIREKTSVHKLLG